MIKQPPYRGMQTADVRRFSSTPRISNGGLLMVLLFALHAIAYVSGQVIALNSATAHMPNVGYNAENHPRIESSSRLINLHKLHGYVYRQV